MFFQISSNTIFPLQKIERWGFDSELLFIAYRKKLSVKEVSVTWKNDPNTKVKFPQDLIRSFSELLQIRFNYMKNLYN